MSHQHYDLLKRNFILKREGHQLYLPCRTPIGSKAPPYVPASSYVCCETTRFDSDTGTLYLNAPTDYTPRNAASYATSVRMYSDAILAAGVKSFLILYGSSHWLGPVDFESTRSEGNKVGVFPTLPSSSKSNEMADGPSVPPKPLPLSIRVTIAIAFQDLMFDGDVIRFTRFVHTRLGEVTFEIPYPTCRKEYDAIKGYFEKVLRKRTVDCQIAIEVAGRDILSKSARFVPEEPFDFTLIERVGEYIVRETVLHSNEDVSIVEEKLKLIAELDKKYRNFEGLLDTLSKLKKSKHYHHLRHLSSLQEAGIFRLRMTGKPVSFIFVVKSTLHYHLIWETYETKEATYIWRLTSLEGQPQRQEMNDLVEKIKWLRDKNKRLYLESPPSNFTRIEHDYSQPDGGIEKWKASLALYLT